MMYDKIFIHQRKTTLSPKKKKKKKITYLHDLDNVIKTLEGKRKSNPNTSDL